MIFERFFFFSSFGIIYGNFGIWELFTSIFKIYRDIILFSRFGIRTILNIK